MGLNFEFRRKLAHILLGIIVILLFNLTNLSPLWLIVLALFSQLAFIINMQVKFPPIEWLLSAFERDAHKETSPAQGLFFLLIGCGLTLLIFPRDIAFAAISVLAFGDSISAIVGKSIGRTRHNNTRKTWEGTIAGFFAGALSASIFISLPLAILASAAGMGIETLEELPKGRHLEDNLSVPLCSALAVFILRLLSQI